MRNLTGADIICECLIEQGVDTVFGYPGGAVLNIYDSLYNYSDKIHHVLTAHEQGASHAADGYARSTGRTGVVIATSGPGATNLVTGIATAYMDSVPMVAITGNVACSLLGLDSFQEVDITGITMPITKHNFIVKDVNKLADTLREAFYIAGSGRKGPVLVDVPKDITAQKAEFVNKPLKPYTVNVTMHQDGCIAKAAELIKNAERPFLYTGGGIYGEDGAKTLKAFAELIDAPVSSSLMGQGSFDETDSRYMGMLGMHGTKASNLGVTKCDLLITVGSRFSDRVIGNASRFAKNAKILQIDVDPAEINKNIQVDCSIIGDLKEVLTRLNQRIEKHEHKEWIKEIETISEEHPLKYNEEGLTGPYVIEQIYKVTEGNAIITTDVGQHQMWAAQYYRYKDPRTFLSSGGLGTMGYGVGAAIGAKVGRPDKVVLNIAGDGCFRMNMNEIATAARYNIPIIQVVINNHVLGMVRQWQTLFYGKRYSQTILNDGVDFVKVAEALGAEGIRVTKKEEVAPAVEKAIALGKPVVIDCVIDCDDKVFPMVPAGAPIEDVFDQDDLNKEA